VEWISLYYFDHAASSWPKPPQVAEAMMQCLNEYGANPGRGGPKMAVQASRTLFDTRQQLAHLLHVHNANDIAFALNASAALNLAIKGYVKLGQHVISTSIEHNSVRRPLEYLVSKLGIHVTYIQSDSQGRIDLKQIERAIRPETAMIVCSHGSNLLGSILPIAEIGDIARRAGVKLVVDAAQTAGTYPIDVSAMGIDMLAFPGHKGLLGPQGTGGLYIHPDIELEPLIHGGTGSRSEDKEMPQVRPDRYEGGTPNTVGIAGLGAGVKFVREATVEHIHQEEWKLAQRLMEGLLGMDGIKVLGPSLGQERTGIVSFVLEDVDCSETAFLLDKNYGIAVRSGYHCTPLGHESAGTLEGGAVRASVGYFTTLEEVNVLIDAIREIRETYSNR
jgi:cysteine desulfurase family protein